MDELDPDRKGTINTNEKSDRKVSRASLSLLRVRLTVITVDEIVLHLKLAKSLPVCY